MKSKRSLFEVHTSVSNELIIIKCIRAAPKVTKVYIRDNAACISSPTITKSLYPA